MQQSTSHRNWKVLFIIEAVLCVPLIAASIMGALSHADRDMLSHANIRMSIVTFCVLVLMGIVAAGAFSWGAYRTFRGFDARLAGLIHGLVGGIFILPLSLFMLVGVTVGLSTGLPPGSVAWTVGLVIVALTIMAPPVAGIILSRGQSRRSVLAGHVLGFVSLMLGLLSYSFFYVCSLAGWMA
jgi:hypothetical protein